MSNRVYIETYEVKRIRDNDTCNEIRIWDNYNQGNCNIETIPDSDIDILQYLKDYGSDDSAGVCDVIDTLLEYQKGVCIRDTWYDWDEIEHIFEDDCNSCEGKSKCSREEFQDCQFNPANKE